MGNLDGFRARHSMAEGPPQFNAAICTDHTLRMGICRAFQQLRAPPRILDVDVGCSVLSAHHRTSNMTSNLHIEHFGARRNPSPEIAWLTHGDTG
jgi:hypothetical protein